MYTTRDGYFRATTGSINYFAATFASGNIASGTFTLYGLVKS